MPTSKTPTYIIWNSMIQRAKRRGLSVCFRWLKYKNFVADMGKRPTKMTLDRIDNSSGYYPDNCRCTTMKQQDPFDDFKSWLIVGFGVIVPWMVGVIKIVSYFITHIKWVK